MTRRLEFDANGGPKPEVVVYDVVTLTRNGWEIVSFYIIYILFRISVAK